MSTHSRRSASRPCAAQRTALASIPAQHTASPAPAWIPANISETLARPRHRVAAAAASGAGKPGRGSSPATGSESASSPARTYVGAPTR